MPIYCLKPNDVLFFRDARRMTGSSSGHGARWPEPNVIFFAFHAAMHRAFPNLMQGEQKASSGQRFGSLQTAGPFPLLGAQWFFRAPADVLPNGLLTPMKTEQGRSNLPQPLRYPVGSTGKPSKEQVPPWWSKPAMESYLIGGRIEGARRDDRNFFDEEWVTGIGIDPETQAQDHEHIYSALYLRLRDKDGAAMGVFATMPMKQNSEDGIRKLFAENNHIIVGGQQRLCRVFEIAGQTLDQLWPVGPSIKGDQVKWVLLSPAVFPQVGEQPGGWLPNWVDHKTGRVLLRAGPGRNKARRKNLSEGKDLDVALVASRVPKPIHFSGWSERLHLKHEPDAQHGARPTFLAVPAGAVYYFKGPDAPVLADLLNWHGQKRENVREIANRRSTLFGEQGFGLGVCGPWTFSEAP